MFGSRTLACTAMALLAATTGIAQDVEGAIKARQAHMTVKGHNMGVLGAMARDRIDYDATAAQRAADNLVALASIDQATYWVSGSSSVEVEDSAALPALFNDPEGFTAAQEKLVVAAAAMQAAAGESKEAMLGAMGALGASCGGCHENYRKPQE